MRLPSPARWAPLLMLAGFVTTVSMGCAPSADNQQQVQTDQDALRGTVASDQQQIDSLAVKIQRLEDRVSELEHNGPGSDNGADQLSSIEQRLDKLESQKGSAPAGAPSSEPGSSGPATTPSEPLATSTKSQPPSPPQPAPGAAGQSNAGASDTPGSEASGNESSSNEASTNEVASVPLNSDSSAPAAVSNAPSWQAMMDHELTTSHDDPGEKLYHGGLVQLKANEYPQALGQLQTLQHRYPKSSLSEPAEFFAANALYEMGNYDKAILQFNDQTMRFPKGHYASAALLREAQAFVKINDRIDARLTLQKLLNDLPDSPEAPTAKSMMQTLTS